MIPNCINRGGIIMNPFKSWLVRILLVPLRVVLLKKILPSTSTIVLQRYRASVLVVFFLCTFLSYYGLMSSKPFYPRFNVKEIIELFKTSLFLGSLASMQPASNFFHGVLYSRFSQLSDSRYLSPLQCFHLLFLFFFALICIFY